ncbi:MAG: PilZ domain-containing protein [Acidimicrobiales bacterium]
MLATLAVNAVVGIEVTGWDEALSTRIEDVEPTEVTVADPSPPARTPPPVGDRVTLTWVGTFGPQHLATTLVAVGAHPVPHWRLRADGPATSDQRRSHVRALNLTAATVLTAGSATPARLVDLSEGGAHVVARPPAPLAAEARVTLRFELEGSTLEVGCDVVRVHELGGRVHAGCRFTGLPGRDADRIRAYVFRRQALERARSRP